MIDHTVNFLRLMQMADSALPIGTLAHSYGLETLVQDSALTVERLQGFLQDYLSESGRVEATFCHKAYHAAQAEEWLHLNTQLDALKLARESRDASATLGRRFLQLALKLNANSRFAEALQTAKSQSIGIHYCTAFGLTCGVWNIEPDMAIVAFLQQSITSLVSACQRLMPLGQTDASRMIWELKPAIIDVSRHCAESDFPPMFTAAVEVGSMRHPDLATRLFIS